MRDKELSFDNLYLDPEKESEKIEKWVRDTVLIRLKRKGVVIGLSGGIDSSVCAAICMKALGRERVFGLFTPEKECEEETNDLGRVIADHLSINAIEENITDILDGAGCYPRRNDAIRMMIPQFKDEWGSKVVVPSIIESNRLAISSIVVKDPEGSEITKRMNLRSYLKVIAASNMKQRSRKLIEYYHAERLNYAVIGTPNKLEYDLGFFVRYGDGAADLKPIAHLYKSQVYQIGKYYGLPEKILSRPPTTDTFSLPQDQEEFYFSLPYREMDLALFAYSNGYSSEELSNCLGLDPEIGDRIYRDIISKMKVANGLKLPPLTL